MKSGGSTNRYLVHVLEIVGNAIIGGVEQYVYHLARHLPSQGFKVTCVTPYESPVTARLRELGSLVYVTHMDDDPPWRSVQFLTELVRHQGVDLIHAHLPKAHVLAGLVGCLTNTPTVMTVHGMDISSWELGIQRTTQSLLHVVCQTAYAQALSLGVSAERVTMIPNGVDLQNYHPHQGGTEFRKGLKIPSKAPLVGFVGRLAFEKGPDIFIQFADYVHRHAPEVHFVMIGDGPMRSELQEQIDDAGIGSVLHLAGSRSDMPEIYPALDVLVQTSRVEGMPFTLLEAMASGVPVAAMNVGGVAEIVEVGSTGFLSALGDWAGLGNAVLQLILSPALRKDMGTAARQRVERKFDLNTSLDMVAAHFRSLVPPSLPTNSIKTNHPAFPKDLNKR